MYLFKMNIISTLLPHGSEYDLLPELKRIERNLS